MWLGAPSNKAELPIRMKSPQDLQKGYVFLLLCIKLTSQLCVPLWNKMINNDKADDILTLFWGGAPEYSLGADSLKYSRKITIWIVTPA